MTPTQAEQSIRQMFKFYLVGVVCLLLLISALVTYLVSDQLSAAVEESDRLRQIRLNEINQRLTEIERSIEKDEGKQMHFAADWRLP